MVKQSTCPTNPRYVVVFEDVYGTGYLYVHDKKLKKVIDTKWIYNSKYRDYYKILDFTWNGNVCTLNFEIKGASVSISVPNNLNEMDGGGVTGNATGGIGGTGLGMANSYTQLSGYETYDTPKKKSSTKEYIKRKKSKKL